MNTKNIANNLAYHKITFKIKHLFYPPEYIIADLPEGEQGHYFMEVIEKKFPPAECLNLFRMLKPSIQAEILTIKPVNKKYIKYWERLSDRGALEVLGLISLAKKLEYLSQPISVKSLKFFLLCPNKYEIMNELAPIQLKQYSRQWYKNITQKDNYEFIKILSELPSAKSAQIISGMSFYKIITILDEIGFYRLAPSFSQGIVGNIVSELQKILNPETVRRLNNMILFINLLDKVKEKYRHFVERLATKKEVKIKVNGFKNEDIAFALNMRHRSSLEEDSLENFIGKYIFSTLLYKKASLKVMEEWIKLAPGEWGTGTSAVSSILHRISPKDCSWYLLNMNKSYRKYLRIDTTVYEKLSAKDAASLICEIERVNRHDLILEDIKDNNEKKAENIAKEIKLIKSRNAYSGFDDMLASTLHAGSM